jgi:hypothetical protein
VGAVTSRLKLAAILSFLAAGTAFGQGFGGSPPWGLEKPTNFSGEVHHGEGFNHPIGNGLSLSLTPRDGDLEASIRSSSGGDYSSCATPPFHGPNPRELMAWHSRSDRGPGGVGQKRWIDFVLSDEDNRLQCEQVDLALQGKNTFENPISGRCWFRPLSVKLSDGPPERQTIEELKFDGECALHGALELWRLPATYVIDDGFAGWVTVYYREKDQAGLSRSGERYLLRATKSTAVHTSSDLRQDSRGAKFTLPNGHPVPTQGRNRMIWGWQTGDADMCSPYQSFFVGTRDQYAKADKNPLLQNPVWDCSKILRVEQ